MNFEDSIVNLVKKLCYTVRNEHSGHDVLRNNKSDIISSDKDIFRHPFIQHAYEVLLKKYTKAEPSLTRPPQPLASSSDLHIELEFCRLEMKLAAADTSASFTVQQQCAQFDQSLDKINAEHLLDDDTGRSIFQFILALKKTVISHEKIPIGFGNFYFNNSNEPRQPYRLIPSELTMFSNDNDSKWFASNPYIISSDKGDNKFMKLFLENQGIVADVVAPHANLFRSILPKTKMPSCDRWMAWRSNCEKSTTELDDETKKRSKQLDGRTAPIFMKSLRWEHLGESINLEQREPTFASETEQANLHMLSINEAQENGCIPLHLIPVDRFIGDLKLLLVGVASLTFRYDEDSLCFRMANSDITIENVAKTTLATIVESFLECGSCCARLRILCTSDSTNFQMKFNGFVFQALCKCIDEYLTQFGRVVLNFTDRTLLSFSQRLIPSMLQIQMLAKVLAIHPDVYGTREFPRGSQFLSYLYREIAEISLIDTSMLLVYILQQCCRVYFRFLEIWIFHGCIEDPASELFIEHHNHYRTNTKYFWDKAYVVRCESVPGFLRGFEESILLCGKYTMLLKAFRADHPLLSLRPPKLEVCLSATQIARQQQYADDYCRNAAVACGPPVSVVGVFRQKAAQRDIFMRRVAEKFQENLKKWRLEQDELRIAKRELHEQDRAALQQQIIEVRERKIESQRQRLALEREHLRLEQLCEEERLLREAEHRRQNIEYYTELGELVDAQRAKAVLATMRRQPPTTVDSIESLVGSVDEKSPDEGVQTSVVNNESDRINDDDIDDDESFHSLEENFSENVITTRDGLVALKKSASDFFNSNEIQTTEAHANKLKVLGSGFDFHDYAPPHPPTIKYSATATKDTNSNVITPLLMPLTAREESKRNKNKILGQEFDIFCPPPPPTITIALPDVSNGEKAAAAATTELTVLQRNRKRVMNPTDVELNHQQVLNEEFGGSYKKLQLDLAPTENHSLTVAAEASTPMSTSSDTPVMNAGDLNKDNDNNNVTTSVSRLPSLKLNVQIQPHNDILSTALLSNPTPPSGICSTAAPADDCFNFNMGTDRHHHQQNDKTLIALTDETAVQNDAHHNYAVATDEILDLNMTTITHYLQLSFVLPMQSYLSVLKNEVLRIYLCDLDILGHFKSLRNYFFMMDGEFASHICDGIIAKLESADVRPQALFNYNVLHSLLGNALGLSNIGNDVNAENLSFYVDDVPDQFDLKSPNALSALSLSYAVEWPLNLLLNSETIAHYANIFRHLLKLRRIRWVLDKTFEMLKETARMSARKKIRSPQYDHVQQIRNKLLGFVNALQNHITSNALQVSWRRFKSELTTATSIEHLYQKHTAYMKRVEFLCMLNKSSHEFLAKLHDVFVVVLRFYRKLKARNWRRVSETEFCHPNFEKLLVVEQDFDRLIRYILHAGAKMSRRGYQTEIDEFIRVLNFNGYYNDEKKCLK